METALKETVRRVVEAVHPLQIILFGSAARGVTGPNSDLDLLVVVPDGLPCRRSAMYLYDRLLGVGFAVDLVVTTPSRLERHRHNPGLIYEQALNHGREVYRAV